MKVESMDEIYQAAPDVYVLPTHLPIPGFGVIPINAFVILAEEPVLVDTGIAIESQDFLKALRSVIDLKDIRWLWLTHDDIDHMGSVQQVLEEAPQARLVTHAFSALRMSAAWRVPLNRVYALSIGESINVGDRKLMAIKPPLFDNPTSIGIYSDKSRAFFSVDSFGALLPRQEKNASDFTGSELTQGMVTWATFDSSWVHLVDEVKFGSVLDKVRKLDLRIVLSSHLPMAHDMNEHLLKVIASLPSAKPFVAPNQTIFSQIANQITALQGDSGR